MALHGRRHFAPAQHGAPPARQRDHDAAIAATSAPKLGSFINELCELEARVTSSQDVTPDGACSVRERLEVAVWARNQQLELEERDLNMRVRYRAERQAAARGWIDVVAQGVGVATMAVVAAIGMSAAAEDYRAMLGLCALTGAGTAAGLAKRYVRRQS